MSQYGFSRRGGMQVPPRSPVMQLLVVNLGLFLAGNLAFFVVLLFQGAEGASALRNILSDWLAMPYNLEAFAFRPWTLLTAAFFHQGFFHFLFNMVFLYFLGGLLQTLHGASKIWPLYLLGGILGNIFSFLIFQAPGTQAMFGASSLLGASGALMAFMFAAARLYPNMQVQLLLFGAVRLKYIAIFYFLLNVLMLGSASNLGGTLAHLGGGLAGLLYAWQFQKGKDWLARPARWYEKISGQKEQAPVMMKVQYGRTLSDYEYREIKAEREATLDELLDKINEKGFNSLNRKEKALLQKYSKQK